MEDYNNLCEICLESFNISDKLPKILDCCKKSFCLSCLKDIYRTNKDKLVCPICRKITNKSPTDLIINKDKLEPSLICPACRTCTTQSNLKIKVSPKGLSTIVCAKCSPDHLSDNLSEYLINVSEEMNFFIDSFCNIKTEVIEEVIDFQLTHCIDHILQQIIKSIKSKIKSKIMTNICGEYDLIAEDNNFTNVFKQFVQFKENYESILEMNKVKIKNKDYPLIKSYVDYYIYNSENIQKNGMKLKKINEHINNNSIVSFNKMLVDYDDVENLLENFFEVRVKGNNDPQNLRDKKCSFSAGDNFSTGVKFIDEKFFNLKKDNENLYENFLKGDLQIKKLERELAALRNNANNNCEKEICKNCKNRLTPDKNNSQSIQNSNINLNDIEFNIIRSYEPNEKSIFNIKSLFIQNFNFSIHSKITMYTQRNFSNVMNINNYTNINSIEIGTDEYNLIRNTKDDIEKKLFDLECVD